MEKIVLDCLKCGAPLEITQDMELFRCPYCGMNHLVERVNNFSQLIPLERRVEHLESEQARFQDTLTLKEIEQLDQKKRALIPGKPAGTIGKYIVDTKAITPQLLELEQKKTMLISQYIQEGGKDTRITDCLTPISVSQLISNAYPSIKLEITFDDRGSLIWIMPDHKWAVLVILSNHGVLIVAPLLKKGWGKSLSPGKSDQYESIRSSIIQIIRSNYSKHPIYDCTTWDSLLKVPDEYVNTTSIMLGYNSPF